MTGNKYNITNEEALPCRKHPVHLLNVERYNQPVILFVTVCSYRKRPILANETMHEALTQAWNEAQSHRVGFYMIMPDHIHLFCSPSKKESENVRKWIGYWKRIVNRKWAEPAPLWQRDCWDTQLRDVSHYADKWKYFVQNPVRRGLVSRPEEWAFTGILNELRW